MNKEKVFLMKQVEVLLFFTYWIKYILNVLMCMLLGLKYFTNIFIYPITEGTAISKYLEKYFSKYPKI